MREVFESTIERLLADTVTPALMNAAESGAWPSALWQAIADSGFALAAALEALGGAGASWDDLQGVVRACGRFHAPVPLPEAMLANWLLGQAGLDALSDAVSFSTSVLRLAGGAASGTLDSVPWGRDIAAVVALAEDAGGRRHVVQLSASAARCSRQLNMAGEPRDTLVFDAVVPQALAPLPDTLDGDVLLQGGALLRSAQIAGALQSLLDMSSRYATERVQFGKPIGNFQAIQHQLAVLAEHTALARVSAEAAFAESDNTLAPMPIAVAKVNASEAAGTAAGIAHAVHGAIGFTHEHALHWLTRRLWAWRSEFGSATAWSQRLGRSLCAAGAAGLWPAITQGSLPQEARA